MVFPSQSLPLRPSADADMRASTGLRHMAKGPLAARNAALTGLASKVRDFLFETVASGTSYTERELDHLEGIIEDLRQLPHRAEA